MSTELEPEEIRAILEKRARALARPLESATATSGRVELMSFELAGERYAIEARFVREVVRLTDFVRVPGLPDFVVGVTNVRGEIVAIIDIRRFFGLAARGLTDLSRLVVLGEEAMEFAILADRMHEVTELAVEGLLPPPATIRGAGRVFLRGVTATGLILLDGAVLMRDPRLVIDARGDRGTASEP